MAGGMNIGTIQFGIDANTEGLRKAGAAISAFRSKVGSAADDQVRSAAQTTKAFGRQESAMKKAREQAIALQAAMLRAGMSVEKNASSFNAVDNALNRYIQEMSSGVLSTTNFARAQDGLAAKLNRTKREFSGFSGGKLVDTLRNLESAAVLAVGPLSRFGAMIRSIGAIASRSNLKVVALYGGITALSLAFFKLAQAGVQSNRVFEQAEARFEALTGSPKAAAREMAYVTEVANRMGLRVTDAAVAFSRFSAAAQGTKLQGEGARKVFEGISAAAAALRLGAGEVEGVFRAVEQMLSKGNVQAEELRGQLGERLPGAFRLAAESMKVTTQELNKMLKDGKVLAEDFLPLLAQKLSDLFGEEALKNQDSFIGSMNIMVNHFMSLTNAVNDTFKISNAIVWVFKALGKTFEFAKEHMQELTRSIVSFAAASLVFTGPALLRGVILLGGAIKTAAVATWAWARAQIGLNAAMLANPGGKIVSIVLRLGAAIAVFAATYLGMEWLIEDTTNVVDDALESFDDLADTIAGVANAADRSTEFKNFQKELQDIINKSKAMDNAFAWGSDADTELTRINTRMQLLSTTTKEMGILAKQLGAVMGEEIPRQIELFIEKYLEFIKVTAAREKAAEDEKEAANAVAEALKNIADQQARLEAMKGGEAQLKVYDQITSKVNEFVAGQIESNVNAERAAELGRELHSVLVQQMVVMDEQKRIQAAINAEKKETLRIEKEQIKANKQLTKAAQTIELMSRKISAIRLGPDAIREFEQITRPLEQFRDQLENSISDSVPNKMALINEKVAEYNDLLIQQAKMSGVAAEAAQGLANAIGNTFEDAIISGKSFKDTLTSIVDELWKVMLRILIIDPLIKEMTTSMQNAFAPMTNNSGGLGGIFSKMFKRKQQPNTQTGQTPAAQATPGQQLTAAAKQQFKAADKFDTVVDEFREAIAMMQQCVCSGGGGEGGSAMTEAADALFRSSMEMGTTAYDLDSASGDLKNASYSLENTARSFEAAAMKDQQMQKANKWMDLIQTGVSAYGSMSSMGSASTLDAGGGTSSPGRTSFILGDNPKGMTPTSYSGMSMDEVNAILPGRAFGGMTSRGGLHPVMERGQPELFSTGNRKYLMSPSSGRVEPVQSSNNSGGNTTNLTIVMPQQTTNRTAAQNARAIGKEQSRVMGRNS